MKNTYKSFLVLLLLAGSLCAQRPGLQTRVEWTKSRVIGSPEPPPPYALKIAYPDVRFENPIAGVPVPGAKQLMIVEYSGKIWLIDEDRQANEKELVVDMGTKTVGLALHPMFFRNGRMFVTTIDDTRDEEVGSRVAEFQVQDGKVNKENERTIIEWKRSIRGPFTHTVLDAAPLSAVNRSADFCARHTTRRSSLGTPSDTRPTAWRWSSKPSASSITSSRSSPSSSSALPSVSRPLSLRTSALSSQVCSENVCVCAVCVCAAR